MAAELNEATPPAKGLEKSERMAKVDLWPSVEVTVAEASRPARHSRRQEMQKPVNVSPSADDR